LALWPVKESNCAPARRQKKEKGKKRGKARGPQGTYSFVIRRIDRERQVEGRSCAYLLLADHGETRRPSTARKKKGRSKRERGNPPSTISYGAARKPPIRKPVQDGEEKKEERARSYFLSYLSREKKKKKRKVRRASLFLLSLHPFSSWPLKGSQGDPRLVGRRKWRRKGGPLLSSSFNSSLHPQLGRMNLYIRQGGGRDRAFIFISSFPNQPEIKGGQSRRHERKKGMPAAGG